MQENEKNMIVTETPILEIDGRFFQSPFEAEKYLVQIRWMRVAGARERVRELVNETLNKPQDASRRDFLLTSGKLALSSVLPSPTKLLVQWLWSKMETAWAQNLWDKMPDYDKNDARYRYVWSLFSGCWVNTWFADQYPGWTLNMAQKLFFYSPLFDRQRFDQSLINDLPTARQEYLTYMRKARSEADPFLRADPLFSSMSWDKVEKTADTRSVYYLSERSIARLSYTTLTRQEIQDKVDRFSKQIEWSKVMEYVLGRQQYKGIPGKRTEYTSLADIFLDMEKDLRYSIVGQRWPQLSDASFLTRTEAVCHDFDLLKGSPLLSKKVKVKGLKKEISAHMKKLRKEIENWKKCNGWEESSGHVNAIIEEKIKQLATHQNLENMLEKHWITMSERCEWSLGEISNWFMALRDIARDFRLDLVLTLLPVAILVMHE